MARAFRGDAGTSRTDTAPGTCCSLPVSKLTGATRELRSALKRCGIASSGQLLHAAGEVAARHALAQASGIASEDLLRLVQRADMARVRGVGAVFAQMLERLQVRDVQTLAAADGELLERRLQALNRAERWARRAPTLAEIRDWIRQAQRLPVVLRYDAEAAVSPSTSAMP